MLRTRFYSLFSALDDAVSAGVGAAPDLLEKAGTILPVEGLEEETSTAAVEVKGEKKEEPTQEELDDLGLSKQQVAEARQLFAALRDPTKSAAVVEFLATKAGFVRPPETAKEVKEQKKGIVDDLKEALGPELAYLADKMGPVLQKHLEEQIEASQVETKQKLSSLEEEKLADIGGKAQDAIGKKYFDGQIPDKLIDAMSKVISDGFNASKGQAIEDYLDEVLTIAAKRTGVQLSAKTKNEKIERNRNDAGSRLASDGSRPNPKVGERTIHPQRQMDLKESINLALEQAKTALTQ